jgi:DNA-binding beta-propeller fold protein YncE
LSFTTLLIGIVLAVGACTAPRATPTTDAATPASKPELPCGGGLIAYVASTFDQSATTGTVTPVCLSSGRIARPMAVGGQPFWIVASSDGHTAYVANSGWGGPHPQDTVTELDLTTGRPTRSIPAGLGPMGLALTPNGSTIYVADMGTNLSGDPNSMVAADTVTPVDTAAGSALHPITVGPGPGTIAITPDGRTALVGLDGTPSRPLGEVVPIDLMTGRVGPSIPTGIAPMGVAITPDGRKALVVNTGWSAIGHTVTPIDLATHTAGPPIEVGEGPISIAMTPDGTKAFIAGVLSDVVTPIDVTTDTPLPAIHLSGSPQYVAMSPNGTTVYTSVSNGTRSGFLVPIDARTDRPGTPIPLPFRGGAILITDTPLG